MASMQGLRGWQVPSAEVEYMGDPAVITAKSVFNVRAGPAETVWIAAE